jgi:hypothetical protein
MVFQEYIIRFPNDQKPEVSDGEAVDEQFKVVNQVTRISNQTSMTRPRAIASSQNSLRVFSVGAGGLHSYQVSALQVYNSPPWILCQLCLVTQKVATEFRS